MQQKLEHTTVSNIRNGEPCQIFTPDVSELLSDQERIRAMQQRLQHLETVYS